ITGGSTPPVLTTSPRAGGCRITAGGPDRGPGASSLSCSERRSVLTGSTLIGRDGELARFAHALDLSVAGLPQVIMLEGDPGMGKTALLNHFLEQRRHEWHLTRVTCDRFEAQTNFATAGLLLGDWLDGSQSSIVVGRRLLEWFGG